MTLADGTGKTVSVPLSQPSGPTVGGDATNLKSKEEVKTGEFSRVQFRLLSFFALEPDPFRFAQSGGPFDKPSASFPGDKTKIQSETKSGELSDYSSEANRELTVDELPFCSPLRFRTLRPTISWRTCTTVDHDPRRQGWEVRDGASRSSTSHWRRLQDQDERRFEDE